MPTYFQKPENALKRANEFIKVGEKESALEVLNDVLRSRKHRGKWTSTHEEIMLLFTQLCIDLHRSSFAKDGLYQYRNICKESNPASFEKVVNKFLENAEKKATKAREESDKAVLQDVEDLDVVITPESLLLSTVSGEGAKERSDRVLVTPWVKFLWESYRNMLELLKNNNTVQTVYTAVAKDAFRFCLSFQRRTEFRKLCDTLHNHLTQAQKYQNQPYSLKFDQPDTVQCLVDVRFDQLESSIKIDLWQEAFRAIEEIHHLLGISGKTPKPALLENFYVKQAKVYWMARNKLFHTAALHKLFVLRKEQKKTFSSEETQRTASQVLVSTLCIPIEPVPCKSDRFLEVDDNMLDKTRRLSALLRLTTPPTRASLLCELIGYGVVEHASPEVRQLYRYLEVEFDPLLLSGRVAPILDGLRDDPELGQYVDALQDITLVRLIKQVSQVYDSIDLERLAQLAPFTNITHLEKVVVETARSNNIPVRIDHSSKSLSFGQELSFSYKEEAPEGAHVQAMPSGVLCSQLTLLSEALQQAARIVSEHDIENEQAASAKKTSQEYIGHHRSDHRHMTQRKNLIESRKEFIENTNKAREQEECTQRTRREKEERKAEKERLQREAKKREEQRKNAEMKELKRRQAEDQLEKLKKTPVGARALADLKPEDLDNMDAEDIFSKQLKQIEKEKRDKEGKLRAQEKKVDYLERAKRLVEVPLLHSWHEEQRTAGKRFHEEQQEADIAQAIADRKQAEEVNSRLNCMRGDEKKFREEILEKRKSALKDKMISFQEVLSVAREKRLAQRKEDRRKRRKAEAAATAEEEDKRLKRLEAERETEEVERQRRDDKAAKEEASLKLEQTRLKQEQRMKEIEEKQNAKEDERRMADSRRMDAPPRESGDGNWRRRQSPDREENRYPPSRRVEEEPQRGSAYRPPGGRGDDGPPGWRGDDGPPSRRGDDGPGDWRKDDRGDRDLDRRGPPSSRGRDYDSPRTGRRDFEERRGYDERRPTRDEPDGDSWRRPPPRGEDRPRRTDNWGRGDDEDRRGPSQRDDAPWRGRDSDQGPPRSRDEGGGWRGRDEGDRRGPPRRDEGGGGWRGRDEGDRGGGGWRGRDNDDRRGPPPRDDQRDDGRSLRAEDAGGNGPWRRGGGGGSERDGGWRDAGDRSPRVSDRRRDPSPRDKPDLSPERRKDDEGFETVSRKR